MSSSRDDHAKTLSLAVHEFRSPITVVAGYLRMVLGHFGGSLSDEQRRLLQEAEKSCGRLSALVSEMAELAAIEAGQSEPLAEPVQLFEMLEEVAGSMHEESELGIRLKLHGASGTALVRANPDRLRRALASLITSVVREYVEPADIDVRLSIESDGPNGLGAIVVVGGPEAVVEGPGFDSLWGPFQQWRGGLGFSLQLARATIERAGGRLWSPVKSGGRGAVRLMLPLEERRL